MVVQRTPLEQTYRIRCTVRVCKPLLDAVVKSYGIKRKRKVILNHRGKCKGAERK